MWVDVVVRAWSKTRKISFDRGLWQAGLCSTVVRDQFPHSCHRRCFMWCDCGGQAFAVPVVGNRFPYDTFPGLLSCRLYVSNDNNHCRSVLDTPTRNQHTINTHTPFPPLCPLQMMFTAVTDDGVSLGSERGSELMMDGADPSCPLCNK